MLVGAFVPLGVAVPGHIIFPGEVFGRETLQFGHVGEVELRSAKRQRFEVGFYLESGMRGGAVTSCNGASGKSLDGVEFALERAHTASRPHLAGILHHRPNIAFVQQGQGVTVSSPRAAGHHAKQIRSPLSIGNNILDVRAPRHGAIKGDTEKFWSRIKGESVVIELDVGLVVLVGFGFGEEHGGAFVDVESDLPLLRPLVDHFERCFDALGCDARLLAGAPNGDVIGKERKLDGVR